MSWIYGIQSGLFIKIGVANSIPARLKTMKRKKRYVKLLVDGKWSLNHALIYQTRNQMLSQIRNALGKGEVVSSILTGSTT